MMKVYNIYQNQWIFRWFSRWMKKRCTEPYLQKRYPTTKLLFVSILVTMLKKKRRIDNATNQHEVVSDWCVLLLVHLFNWVWLYSTFTHTLAVEARDRAHKRISAFCLHTIKDLYVCSTNTVNRSNDISYSQVNFALFSQFSVFYTILCCCFHSCQLYNHTIFFVLSQKLHGKTTRRLNSFNHWKNVLNSLP